MMATFRAIGRSQSGEFSRRAARRAVAAVGGLLTLGCESLTREEAHEVVEEARLYSEAAGLIGNTVEIAENFTIGAAVEDAALNLLAFYESQLPCAATSLDGNTLLVRYGATGQDCRHKGMSFSGTHEVTVAVNDEAQVVVDHVWTELSNGEIEVSGTAQVTWSGGEDPSRQVVHDLIWTRVEGGRQAEGSGRRVQQPLNGDIKEGFTVTGDAQWKGESGQWELTIDEVEMRWADPVPQEGEYRLETPFNKDLNLRFNRVDNARVEVVVSSGRRDYEFSVTTPL